MMPLERHPLDKSRTRKLGTPVAGYISTVIQDLPVTMVILPRSDMASNRATGPKGKTSRKKKETGKHATKAKPPTNGAAPSGDNVLERGDVFFFYRPNVEETSPEGLLDVRRFHLVLRPEGGEALRLITIGRKMLPEVGNEGQNHWGFVDRDFRTAEELRDAV